MRTRRDDFPPLRSASCFLHSNRYTPCIRCSSTLQATVFLDNLSGQALGSQRTSIDKQLERFRDVSANYFLFDGFRSNTLFKFCRERRTASNEAYAFQDIALAMSRRLV